MLTTTQSPSTFFSNNDTLVVVAEFFSLPPTLNQVLPTVSNPQATVSVPLTRSRAALQPQGTAPVPVPLPPPSAHPPSDTDSDSSFVMNNPPSTEFAEVDQRDQTKPPILTLGKVTPKALNNFADGCEAYFFHKQVAVDKQVQVVVLGIKDHHMRDWYRTSKATIIVMPFADFMTAVQTKLLKDGWQYGLNVEILSSTQGTKLFSEWETEIGAANSLLMGSTYYITQQAIRSHLTANMNAELALDCDGAKTWDIATYDKWLLDVINLDIKCARENKKHKRLVDDALKAE